MADFLSASFLDKPEIGKTSKTEIIRDISQKRIILSSVTGKDYHKDSLLLSSLLWQVRSQIGNEKMQEFMKPLIDDLNSHRESFIKLQSKIHQSKILHSYSSTILNIFWLY